jgi:hypothetical protein
MDIFCGSLLIVEGIDACASERGSSPLLVVKAPSHLILALKGYACEYDFPQAGGL